MQRRYTRSAKNEGGGNSNVNNVYNNDYVYSRANR